MKGRFIGWTLCNEFSIPPIKYRSSGCTADLECINIEVLTTAITFQPFVVNFYPSFLMCFWRWERWARLPITVIGERFLGLLARQKSKWFQVNKYAVNKPDVRVSHRYYLYFINVLGKIHSVFNPSFNIAHGPISRCRQAYGQNQLMNLLCMRWSCIKAKKNFYLSPINNSFLLS